MNLQNAVSQIQNMKNLFRAFEALEEVLSLAASAEQVARERGAEAQKLAELIGERRGELEKLDHMLMAARDAMQGERRQHEADMIAAEAHASKLRAQRLGAFESNFAKAMSLATEERGRLEAAKEELRAEIESLEKDRSRLHGIVSELRAKLTSAGV